MCPRYRDFQDCYYDYHLDCNSVALGVWRRNSGEEEVWSWFRLHLFGFSCRAYPWEYVERRSELCRAWPETLCLGPCLRWGEQQELSRSSVPPVWSSTAVPGCLCSWPKQPPFPLPSPTPHPIATPATRIHNFLLVSVCEPLWWSRRKQPTVSANFNN